MAVANFTSVVGYFVVLGAGNVCHISKYLPWERSASKTIPSKVSAGVFSKRLGFVVVVVSKRAVTYVVGH